MKFNCYNLFLITISIFLSTNFLFSQNDEAFTIVLDAGHGGKDPGNSYHGYTEKGIALKTVLKVGSFLEKVDNFKIIYTRTTDVFIELSNRPKIANRANANLFVSIHCNSVKNFQPNGTETFVMGLSRSDLNLEVAKKENSVILLEDNFKDTYQGFDPNKPESLIGLTILQEENLNNSIILATEIQDNFTNNLKRNSRGIKQQPLWVLDAVYMPSVLIELGFLSNKKEGEFLNSEEGQDQMALQIANAIVAYKKKYFGTRWGVDKTAKNSSTTIITNTASNSNEIVYKVQLLASSKKVALISSNFKGLIGVTSTFDNEIYRYMYGETSNLDKAKEMQAEAKIIGYPDAFVVRF
ncbi:MAG: N-acetylmuramoyl-L-alanine amidase [Flavobacterium sp.]|jgi:N-acetylmuramoyl-L-alanine amidase